MQSVDMSGFDGLTDALDKLLKDMPNKRRAFHEEAAVVLKEMVDKNISASLNDSHGTIRGWQERNVGSGGGYAAVRAMKGMTGANSPGAITNYLENGHKIRTPTGRAKRQRQSRARVAYVDGRHFYQNAYRQAESRMLQLAEDFIDHIADTLGG